MISTEKGTYLRKFTPEMMERVKMCLTKNTNIYDLCIEITGKSIQDHEQDYVNATWPYSFTQEEWKTKMTYEIDEVKSIIAEEVKQVIKTAAVNHMQELYGDNSFEYPEYFAKQYFNELLISDEAVYRFLDREMHKQFPESKLYTYQEVMGTIQKLQRSNVLRNFILKHIQPLIEEKNKEDREIKRVKRNEQAKKRRQAKKQE